MKYKKVKFFKNIDFKSEKGASLIIVISIITGLGFLGLVIINLVMSEGRVAVIDAAKNKVFYVAETGMEYAFGMLKDSSSWRATQADIAVGYGSFIINVDDSTTIVALDDTLFVTVVATVPGYVKTVQAHVIISDNGSLKFAMYAGTTMWLLGNGTVKGDLHANWIAWVSNNYALNGNKTTSPDAVMPTIDWNLYKNAAIAAGQYSTSDIHFKTSDMPINGVWYTTKKIILDNNNITINGTIVAEGDLDIKKENFKIYATPTNYPAIIVGDDIVIDKKNAVIEGLVYAADDITIKNSNHIISGGMIAKGKISHTGSNLTLKVNPTYTSGVNGAAIDSTMLAPPGILYMSWKEK